MNELTVQICLFITFTIINKVNCHGRMMIPPQRGSMWRVGYDVPKDYNDMSGYCGGIKHLWEVSKNFKGSKSKK